MCSSTSDRIIQVIPFELTWKGHEFLSKIRDEGFWQRVKSIVLAKTGALSFDVISDVATDLALKMVTRDQG